MTENTPQNLPSLRISGIENLQGDKNVDNVVISGFGTLNGNIKCRKMTVSGSFRSMGDLDVLENLKVSGTVNIKGNTYSGGKLTTSGTVKIGGNLHVEKKINITGVMDCRGHLYGNEAVKIFGTTKVGGSLIVSNKLDISGKININGDIIADEVEFMSIAASIGILKNLFSSKISGNIIAANSIKLKNIVIGGDVIAFKIDADRNTEINGNLYYVDSFKMSNKTKVNGTIEKITLEKLTEIIDKNYKQILTKPDDLDNYTGENTDHNDNLKHEREIKYCPYCGIELNGLGVFCSGCGLKIN